MKFFKTSDGKQSYLSSRLARQTNGHLSLIALDYQTTGLSLQLINNNGDHPERVSVRIDSSQLIH
jgi:hypothetical protein